MKNVQRSQVPRILCKLLEQDARNRDTESKNSQKKDQHTLSPYVQQFDKDCLNFLLHVHMIALPAFAFAFETTFNFFKCLGSCANFWCRMRATETSRARTARRRTNILCH